MIYDNLTYKSFSSILINIYNGRTHLNMDMTQFTNNNSITELVGTTVLDTIGLVIANIDDSLRSKMNLDNKYRALGLISSRTGAAGQILAVDEAVKTTNCDIISIDLPRDTKGWGGHGNFIIVGSRTLSDAKQCISISLDKIKLHSGEVYISDAGHLEFAYSARAGRALNKAFNAPIDKAFGFICGSPAAIGLVIADNALKAADVEIVNYMTPSIGTSHSNEIIITITGGAAPVKDAVMLARKNGLAILNSMGSIAKSPTGVPYIL